MSSRLNEQEIWTVQKGHRGLWYACTSLGLVSAVFLAPLHGILLIATILIAWGGPLLIEAARDVTIRTVTTNDMSLESHQQITEPSTITRSWWNLNDSVFNLGTGIMWFATLIALFQRKDTFWLLFLGFGGPLLLHGISGIIHNSNRYTFR